MLFHHVGDPRIDAHLLQVNLDEITRVDVPPLTKRFGGRSPIRLPTDMPPMTTVVASGSVRRRPPARLSTHATPQALLGNSDAFNGLPSRFSAMQWGPRGSAHSSTSVWPAVVSNPRSRNSLPMLIAA